MYVEKFTIHSFQKMEKAYNWNLMTDFCLPNIGSIENNLTTNS